MSEGKLIGCSDANSMVDGQRSHFWHTKYLLIWMPHMNVDRFVTVKLAKVNNWKSATRKCGSNDLKRANCQISPVWNRLRSKRMIISLVSIHEIGPIFCFVLSPAQRWLIQSSQCECETHGTGKSRRVNARARAGVIESAQQMNNARTMYQLYMCGCVVPTWISILGHCNLNVKWKCMPISRAKCYTSIGVVFRFNLLPYLFDWLAGISRHCN